MKNARYPIPEEMARAAARWWAERVDGTKRHDNGGNDFTSFMAGMMADTLREPPKVGALERFEKILTEKIVENGSIMQHETFLDVDYSPDRILSEAAKEAGINTNNFPWKTCMCISLERNMIQVRDGYRAPWETIWPETDRKAVKKNDAKIYGL